MPEAHGQIPHSQHGPYRNPGRPANGRPRSGAEHNGVGERPEETGAGQHQEAEGYRNLPGETARDGLASQRTADEESGESHQSVDWWSACLLMAMTDCNAAETEPLGQEILRIEIYGSGVREKTATDMALTRIEVMY